MIVKYYGHSCFLLKSSTTSVAIDPFGDIGYRQEQIQADVCLCTHMHYDHCTLDYVKANKIINENSSDVCDFVTSISTFHDRFSGAKRGKNTIYKFTLDGVTFCHMGDVGVEPSSDLVDSIGKIDVLMIPVGGNYTIDCLQAEKYVRMLKPSIVIPMHYKTNKSNIDIDEKGSFLKLFDCVEQKPREFEINLKSLSEKTTVFDIDDKDF